MSNEELEMKWREEFEKRYQYEMNLEQDFKADGVDLYTGHNTQLYWKVYLEARKSSQDEIDKLKKQNEDLLKFERIARCSYQHSLGIGLSRGYCNKCGWMQIMSEEEAMRVT